MIIVYLTTEVGKNTMSNDSSGNYLFYPLQLVFICKQVYTLVEMAGLHGFILVSQLFLLSLLFRLGLN